MSRTTAEKKNSVVNIFHGSAKLLIPRGHEMGLGEELWAISGKNIEKAKADLKVLASVVVDPVGTAGAAKGIA